MKLFGEQVEGRGPAAQAGPDHAGAGSDLVVELVEQAEIAQLVAAVEDLVEPLARPLLPSRIAAQPIAQLIQLARQAALPGDSPQLCRRGRKFSRYENFGPPVPGPEPADQIALAQGELPLQAGRAKAGEQGGVRQRQRGRSQPGREKSAAGADFRQKRFKFKDLQISARLRLRFW